MSDEKKEEPHNLVLYDGKTSWICCTKYKDRQYFQEIIQDIDLTITQKHIIQLRYINVLEDLQKRTRNYSIVFFLSHFIVSVGSLFVPALLSVQNSNQIVGVNSVHFTMQVYWATFIISLLVTISNGILTLFKIDKKYYFLNTTVERLRTEGWQYIGLTGRYSGHLLPGEEPTHKNHFIFFTHQIEKIKMKQVEEEYYKTDDKIAQNPTTTNNTKNTGVVNELLPLSPDKLIDRREIPESVQEAMKSIIVSQKLADDVTGTATATAVATATGTAVATVAATAIDILELDTSIMNNNIVTDPI